MEDHRDALKVVTWFLLSLSALAIVTRLAIKQSMTRRFDVDDYIVVGALLCNVASGVGTSLAAIHGLGRDAVNGHGELVTMQKSMYVAEIFHVLVLALSKSSLFMLAIRIMSDLTIYSKVAVGIMALVVAWTVASALTVIFQCHAPRFWDIVSSQCIDMTSFWRVYGAMNICTELGLIILPVLIFQPMQMERNKKILVLVSFAMRFFDIGVTGAQLAYTNGFTATSNPPRLSYTLDLWPWFMCAQVLQTVTIISASIPYLRPFLQALPSGMFQPDEIRRRGLNYVDVTQGFGVNFWEANRGKSYTLRDVERSADGSAARPAPDGSARRSTSVNISQ